MIREDKVKIINKWLRKIKLDNLRVCKKCGEMHELFDIHINDLFSLVTIVEKYIENKLAIVKDNK